jgi:hypothetical protein
LKFSTKRYRLKTGGRDLKRSLSSFQQFVDTFGHDPSILAKTFLLLEKLKNHIKSEEFEDANLYVSAFLARYRGVNKAQQPIAGSTMRFGAAGALRLSTRPLAAVSLGEQQ